MSAIFHAAFPVFALIFIGYMLRTWKILGKSASRELNRFVAYLALPSLMFYGSYHLQASDFQHPGFMFAFMVSALLVGLAAVLINVMRHVPLADATIDGLGSVYANTGFIGIPLCVLTFGERGMGPAVMATVFIACIIFGLAILVIEINQNMGTSVLDSFKKVGFSLITNPLIVAPILGLLLSVTHIPVFESLDTMFKMLGQAAGPCALVSLGVFLAQPTKKKKVQEKRSATLIVFLKLIVHPLLTALLVYKVLDLPLFWADTALILSALPVGTGPFMLSEMFHREGVAISRSILFSTIGSLVTLSIIFVLISGHQY